MRAPHTAAKPARCIEPLESRLCFSDVAPVIAPTGLSVEALSSRSARLQWTDNSTNELGFVIYRSADGVNYERVIETQQNETSFIDRTLLPGTTYSYRIKAHARTADSLLSPVVTVTSLTTVADAYALLDPDTGDLTVDGTVSNDVISLNLSGAFVSVNRNGTILTFAKADVKRISVLGLSGHDRITVGTNLADLAINISGGEGNDTIIGSEGNEHIDGGRGNDLIRGGAGDDTLAGGAGKDTIYGEGDDDVLDGGSGNDKLFGGDGTDYMIGAAGSDRLFGQGGIDTLLSGGGRDTLVRD